MEAEKNDVDISKLFQWGRVYVVENSQGEEEALIYMRLLGDADVNKARVYALRKSAELRRKLLDENSDERITLIKTFGELAEEDIINYILIFSMRDVRNDAIRDVKVPLPKQPKSNAKLAAMEKWQKEVDEYPEKRADAINKYIQKAVDNLRKELASKGKEQLYRQYVQLLVEEFCEQEAMRAYSDMECYLGCYKDDEYTKKAFESFEDFDNLDSGIKSAFKAAYSKISIDSNELKKLREVTP